MTVREIHKTEIGSNASQCIVCSVSSAKCGVSGPLLSKHFYSKQIDDKMMGEVMRK